MTEQEDRLKWDIQEAPDCVIETETIPCAFYGTRIVKRTYTSATLGYKFIEDYTWEEAYNTDNVHGGYDCTHVNESIEEVTP